MSAPRTRSLTGSGSIVVAIIDSNPKRRSELATALAFNFKVEDYRDIQLAISEDRPPHVLVVDDSARGKAWGGPVASLREAPAFSMVPIILLRSQIKLMSAVGGSGARDAVPDIILEKPFTRRDLVDAILSVTARKTETAMAELSEPQQKSLREAITMFEGLGDVAGANAVVDYAQVSSICAPIVAAVRDSSFKKLIMAVRSHHHLTYVHSLRVSTLLGLFGFAIGLKEEALQILTSGGLVHDIGKLWVPNEVLTKTGVLTAEERQVVQNHVAVTVNFLERHTNLPKGVITIAAQHHEKLDGSGYPRGLAAKDLNQLARMAAIVDIFVALTDRRCYREQLTADAALKVMSEEMPQQLDQPLLRLFAKTVLEEGVKEWG